MNNSNQNRKSGYLLLSAHYVPSTVLNVMSSPWETKSGWATLGPQPRAQRRTLSACSTAHDAVNTGTLTGQGCGQRRVGLKVHPRLWGKRGPSVTLSKDRQLLQTELRLSMGTRGLGCDQTQGWDPFPGLESALDRPSGPKFHSSSFKAFTRLHSPYPSQTGGRHS